MANEFLLPKRSDVSALCSDIRDMRYRSFRYVFNDEGKPEISATILPQIKKADGTFDPSWYPMKIIDEGKEMPTYPILEQTLLDTWCTGLMNAAVERSKKDNEFDESEIIMAALRIRYTD